MAVHFRDVTVLDLNERIYLDRACEAERNGVVVYRDEQRLSTSFVIVVGDKLTGRIGAQN